MAFDNDIFISYAHIDNQSLVKGGEGWVTDLHRALSIRVGQLLGRDPAIWRDPKLQGNDLFPKTLTQKLPGVAALVAVLSPRYVQSDWCIKELREFYAAAEKSGGVQVSDKLRAFKVIKTPVDEELQPPELGDTLGYEFFLHEPETGRIRELSQTIGSGEGREYWIKVDDLAFDLASLLKQVSAAKAEPAAEPAQTIFLAETGRDLREARETIKRDLRRRGYMVLPDRPLPISSAELEELVTQDLKRSQMAIHLVGESYGFVPDGAERSILELQYQLASSRGTNGAFPRLIWTPPGLDPRDERLRTFLDELRSDPASGAEVDFLQMPLEDLTAVIDRKLENLKEMIERESARDVAADDVRRIYLIYDQTDEAETRDLEDYLFEAGFEVIGPAFEGDDAQLRRDHEETLRICDGTLIYYGRGSELWLRSKMREIQKSAGLGRMQPLKGKGIYVAPPDNPRKDRFRSREASVMRQGNGFEPNVLAPFLESMR